MFIFVGDTFFFSYSSFIDLDRDSEKNWIILEPTSL